MPLHKQLHKALENLNFTEATEVQERAIPAALAGKDVMVSAKTGSGKTAAFILPMLDTLLASDAPRSSTRALILLPTRELALQTQKMFEKLSKFTHIKSGLIIGGESFKYQVATIRKNPEVLIATPGRLVEHIQKGTTDFNDLEFFVLDEADRMLDMGFAEDMQSIATACRDHRQNLLFSATLKHKGMHHIRKILDNPESIEVDSHKEGHSNIIQQIVLADDTDHKQKLVIALIKEEQAKKVFVFCKTREQCQQLGTALKHKDLKAGFIHGEIPQSERKTVLNRFRDNKLQVLVATDVAARGLDVEEVDLVINFTVAHSGDDHVHRVGRTGRAGREGKAITLVTSVEWNLKSSIERYLKVRFEPRIVKNLRASYTGPRKLKKSGKAVGTKKKKQSGKKQTGRKVTPKVRAAARKDKGKKIEGKTSDKSEGSQGDSVWKPINKRK
jgi:superfamily II DNA/RNA helicase